ncbi:hypothetical protein NDU88_010032 [Pleurodeles waltl]|uniref:Uncharacterized protein n=1 Tax=Pleurodeles waltl TaxID=8319 RepID=A0AAV7Q0R4_PLEWA|nr:hypothetical protein NDU88_010032 [Pleurodeles waltl]
MGRLGGGGTTGDAAAGEAEKTKGTDGEEEGEAGRGRSGWGSWKNKGTDGEEVPLGGGAGSDLPAKAVSKVAPRSHAVAAINGGRAGRMGRQGGWGRRGRSSWGSWKNKRNGR